MDDEPACRLPADRQGRQVLNYELISLQQKFLDKKKHVSRSFGGKDLKCNTIDESTKERAKNR